MSLLLLFNPQTRGPRRRATSGVSNRIVLYGPGWTNPQPLPVADLVVSWSVETPGRLSAFVPARELHRLGLDPIAGRWVRYRHPTQGVWGGVVDDEPGTIDERTVEIAATDMRSLLMDRITPILFRQETATAGAIMRRALSATTTDDPILFTSIAADEFGPPLEVEWRGDNAYDLAAALAAQSGQEFDVTVDDAGTVAFIWRHQLGEDKRDTVLIRDGATVVGGRVDRTRTVIVNDLTGIAANEDYALSSSAQFEIPASIETFGRRQALRRYEGVVTPLTVRGKVRADVRVEAEGWYLPTITLPAMHPVALDIRHGDVIRYWSVVKNRELDFRVLSRAVRNGTVLELAGEAVAVRTPPVGPVFSPDMLSGLVAWWDADRVETVDLIPASSNVWRWRDLVTAASAQDPTPGLGSPPDYVVDAHVGRNALRFGAAGHNLTASGWNELAAADNLTVFAVATPRATGGPDTFGVFQIGTATVVGLRLRAVGDTINVLAEGDVGFTNFITNVGWTPGALTLVSITVDWSLATNEVTAWRNGVAGGIRTANANNTAMGGASTSIVIGRDVAGGTTWDGDILELIVFRGVLNDTKRQAVEGSLMSKWGIS